MLKKKPGFSDFQRFPRSSAFSALMLLLALLEVEIQSMLERTFVRICTVQ
jgi:hypothetical protein